MTLRQSPALALALLVLVAAALAAACSPASAKFPRSHAQLVEFARVHPCPSTGLRITSCPSYVIDHVVPLCMNGADLPSNMQWQEYRASLVKDKAERKQCAAFAVIRREATQDLILLGWGL